MSLIFVVYAVDRTQRANYSTQSGNLVLRLTWSNLNCEDIAFVRDLEDLSPDEAIETHSVLVNDQSAGTHADVHQFSVCVLTTHRRSMSRIDVKTVQNEI